MFEVCTLLPSFWHNAQRLPYSSRTSMLENFLKFTYSNSILAIKVCVFNDRVANFSGRQFPIYSIAYLRFIKTNSTRPTYITISNLTYIIIIYNNVNFLLSYRLFLTFERQKSKLTIVNNSSSNMFCLFQNILLDTFLGPPVCQIFVTETLYHSGEWRHLYWYGACYQYDWALVKIKFLSNILQWIC